MKRKVLFVLLTVFVTVDVLALLWLLRPLFRSEPAVPAQKTVETVKTVKTVETESVMPETSSAFVTQTHHAQSVYDHDAYVQKIAELAKRYGAVGVSAALVENGNVVDTFACGSAVIDSLDMTENTKVRIASISKVFVGLCAMISVENGTMSLDEDIGNYWGFKLGTHTDGDVITPRSLLTHTSSVMYTEESDDMYYPAMAERLRTGSGIGNKISGSMSNYFYNNYAIDVLGVTIELANNRTLDGILSERIYGKLGVDAAFYGGDLKNTSEIAELYYAGGEVALTTSKIKSWHKGKPGSKGWGFAGGMTISAKDLGKIVALLANNGVYNGERVLSEGIIDNLEYHEGRNAGKYWQAQPLRYEPSKYGQKDFYYHTGSAYGVLSLAGYSRVTGKGIAVLTTGASRGVAGSDLFDMIANLLLNIE